MNEKYKIIDNFLDPGYYNLIESVFLGNEAGVKWHYQDDMSGHDDGVISQGFSHSIWYDNAQDSEYYPILLPMIERIKYMLGNNYCYRLVSFMTLQNGSKRNHAHHVDMPGIKHTSVIYYLNDSDGDTIIYNEECPVGSRERPALEDLNEYKRITPKANRLLVFQGNQWHSSESPVVSPRRVIFNMNFGDTQI
jgi:hypothetical protein